MKKLSIFSRLDAFYNKIKNWNSLFICIDFKSQPININWIFRMYYFSWKAYLFSQNNHKNLS
jgi:hypothetical protein